MMKALLLLIFCLLLLIERSSSNHILDRAHEQLILPHSNGNGGHLRRAASQQTRRRLEEPTHLHHITHANVGNEGNTIVGGFPGLSTAASGNVKSGYHWGELMVYPGDHFRTNYLSKDWIPMPYAELFDYYTMYEVCMIESRRDEDLCASYKIHDLKECNVFDEGVGMARGVCSNLFGAFLRHKSTAAWPKTKNILDIIHLMKQEGSNTLFLVGDSLTQQHHSETFCSAKRFGMDPIFSGGTGYDHIEFRNPNLPPEDFGNKNHTPYFQVYLIKYCKPAMEEFSLVVPRIEEALASRQLATVGKAVFVINTGLHYNDGDEEAYGKDLKAFLTYFVDLSKRSRHLVIFRETTAQHFRTETGMFPAGKALDATHVDIRNAHYLLENQLVQSGLLHPVNVTVDGRNVTAAPSDVVQAKPFPDEGVIKDTPSVWIHNQTVRVPFTNFCTPFANQSVYAANNWRNRFAEKMIQEMDPKKQHVMIARFFDITAGRHDIHLSGWDCTHYCYTPMLWLPLFTEIYRVLHEHYHAAKTATTQT